jgi:4-amino-4-deoxy-L-arabinose transferase-like glycosyltransferase
MLRVTGRAGAQPTHDKGRGFVPAAFVLCIALVGVFHLVTIREGEDWGDDFSMYIHHAENIAHGIPYAETGYIYNPLNPSVGPRIYPPGFPLLLSPVVKLFGRDLRMMKVELVFFFVGSLVLVFVLFRSMLPTGYLLALVLVMGLNPFFGSFKDHILSDLPFLFFVLLSLCLFLRAEESDSSQRRRVVYACLAGLAAYASYATRVVGIVVLPSLVVHDLIRHRRLTAMACTAAAVFVALASAQYVFWLHDASYADQLGVTPRVIAGNVVSYLRFLSDVWENGYSDAGRKAAFVAASGLAAWGYWRLLRSRAALLAVFPVLYLVPVVVWPAVQGMRFLIPVLPFYFGCCLLGIAGVDAALEKYWGRKHACLLTSIAVVGVIYVSHYSILPSGSISPGIADAQSVQLFDFVRTATAPRDVFVFNKPRALALFTGRRASAPFSPADPCALWQYIREIDATYIVTGPVADDSGVIYLQGFVEKFRPNLQVVLRTRDLAVYRIASEPCVIHR